MEQHAKSRTDAVYKVIQNITTAASQGTEAETDFLMNVDGENWIASGKRENLIYTLDHTQK